MIQKIAVIDYGMGNLHSVAKALATVAPNASVNVTNHPSEIQAASHVVFPGVGAIKDCMQALYELELVDVIRQVVTQKPFLGICVGMQALFEHSEENDGTTCLGIIPGTVRHFENPNTPESTLKVPHMGWNTVELLPGHPLWQGIESQTRFYFVHSYYALANKTEHVAAKAQYGVLFDAAVQQENLFAVQFHPEKSHHAGLQFLANFTNWNGQ